MWYFESQTGFSLLFTIIKKKRDWNILYICLLQLMVHGQIGHRGVVVRYHAILVRLEHTQELEPVRIQHHSMMGHSALVTQVNQVPVHPLSIVQVSYHVTVIIIIIIDLLYYLGNKFIHRIKLNFTSGDRIIKRSFQNKYNKK